MIIDSKGMKEIEKLSGFSVYELMQNAGKASAAEIKKRIRPEDRILIVAGKGNNGGDGYVIAKELSGYACKVYQAEGKPLTEAAMQTCEELDSGIILKPREFARELKKADIIVDAVYGFGFHGELKSKIKSLFRRINESGARIFSIDINSGCEADTDHHDSDAIISEVTFALDCWKPFHMLRKEHECFREAVLVDLGLPHTISSSCREMNEELFFRNFPAKKENAHKGTQGKMLLAGGSYGMAGAISLNITGAKTVGASYIHAALPHEIYPIVASRHITPVFHPFAEHTVIPVLESVLPEASAVGFGSGAVFMPRKSEAMDYILQNSRGPVVLDAEALRMLVHNMYILRFVRVPVIITPHVGEFAEILNIPTSVLMDRKVEYAAKFAKDYNVIVVLKGANTIVAAPNGEMYFNQSGSQALAQAGSGDLLTGIMTGILSMTKDVMTAVCMSVWLHGYLAEIGAEEHAIQNFPIEQFPEFMDKLFKKHGM
ncbi:MAG: NAD(P)H-hydrate dehydratase [Solobacterium sp.]|nr:NAD(P)H-hydrate dehydratase [Solobacterium sp.]